MATLLLAQFVDGKSVVNSFGDYIATNGILGIASGIIFGAASLFWIRAASEYVIMPLLDVMILGGVRLFSKKLADAAARVMFKSTKFRLAKFLQETLTWAVTIAVAFAIIHHGFRRFMAAQEARKKKQEEKEEEEE